jgi:benzoate 4-monooxygenase
VRFQSKILTHHLKGWILLFGLTVTTIYTFGRYFADPKRLRRFPAPSVAAFTPLWLSYHILRARRTTAVHQAHEKLGSVVRIAPNHISFTSPEAFKDIYGHGAPLVKDNFYALVGAGNPSMAQATLKSMHSQKRKNLSHVFSPAQITAMEPRVMEMVRKLCQKLKIKSERGSVAPTDKYSVSEDGAFDVRPWMNMFTYDAITSMFFSDSYGLLDQGNDLCPSLRATGELNTIAAMDSFHSASAFNTTFGVLPRAWYTAAHSLLRHSHGKQSGLNFGGMALYKVTERLKKTPAEPDLFSNLPSYPTEKRPTPMTLAEMTAECATMIDAGNDTTQTTLTNCLYQLAYNPSKQDKLRKVLEEALPKESQPIGSYAELKHIPYLRAVLDESFRCRTPVTAGLPRRTTGEGTTIAGHYIPGDTTVSAQLFDLHRNSDLFKDPLSFIPERWLPEDPECQSSEEELNNLKNYVLPFSLGPRACIGRNLAYMEVSITMAALILSFDWELAIPGSELLTIERFNCNPKELFVKAKARHTSITA